MSRRTSCPTSTIGMPRPFSIKWTRRTRASCAGCVNTRATWPAGLMATELLAYPAHATVHEVLQDLREHAEAYARYDVQYTYVTDEESRLAGVLRMRDLLLAAGGRRILELMIAHPITVRDDARWIVCTNSSPSILLRRPGRG